MLARSPQISAKFSAVPADAADTATKIISFGELESGWHFGEGCPIEESVIGDALDIYWYLETQGLTMTDAFSGADGEILVTAYGDDHYIGVVIESDGRMTFRHECGDDEIKYIETDAIDTIKASIKDAAKEILAGNPWSMFDIFIPEILNVPRTDSTNYPLRPIETEPFQLSNVSA